MGSLTGIFRRGKTQINEEFFVVAAIIVGIVVGLEAMAIALSLNRLHSLQRATGVAEGNQIVALHIGLHVSDFNSLRNGFEQSTKRDNRDEDNRRKALMRVGPIFRPSI